MPPSYFFSFFRIKSNQRRQKEQPTSSGNQVSTDHPFIIISPITIILSSSSSSSTTITTTITLQHRFSQDIEQARKKRKTEERANCVRVCLWRRSPQRNSYIYERTNFHSSSRVPFQFFSPVHDDNNKNNRSLIKKLITNNMCSFASIGITKVDSATTITNNREEGE